MYRSFPGSLFLFLLCVNAGAAELPRVKMQTSMGDMIIELYEDKAPRTVENFLQYVEDDFYDGTIFHRAVYGWLIQGGGYTQELVAKETRDPVRSEASNGLKNERGTIAMARHGDPHSADSQFFINLDNNESFNHRGKTPDRYGYTVFGRVVEGMDVAEEISAVEKVEKQGFGATFPAGPVIVRDVVILNENASEPSGQHL